MKYFTLDEFRCKHCGQLPPNGMNPKLLEGLDKLREAWGAPIYVSSAFRCNEHNAAVGGVPGSEHTKGNAADVYVDGGSAEFERFRQLCYDIGCFDGLGTYRTSQFMHLDTRVNGTDINGYNWIGA